MATIKSYTDISQSNTLSKILPLESADMKILPFTEREYRVVPINDIAVCDREDEIPCWSLAALLSVLPYPSLHKTFSGWRCDSYNKDGTSGLVGETSDNPVDACYDTIVRLYELKML